MKQIIYILLTTTMLGLMSCSDWLDVSPKTSIPTDKQFGPPNVTRKSLQTV